MYKEGMQACTLHFKGSKRYRLIFGKLKELSNKAWLISTSAKHCI